VNEFELIDAILSELGETAAGPEVVIGPGDDASAVRLPPDETLVTSIDALLADVHFPATARPELIGYRALMVSLSDLAAMGARASDVLVSLTLADADSAWVQSLARGMAQAAQATGVHIVGGNLSRGPLAIHVCVQGYASEADLLKRSSANVGDRIYVTGSLGGAAAALRRGGLDDPDLELDDLSRAYFQPQARLVQGVLLRGVASAALDVSDGLLQDLGHLVSASRVGARIDSGRIPLAAGATLADALSAGDDYELLFTSAGPLPDLQITVSEIGEIVSDEGIWLDDDAVDPAGYQHF
jgi:thiamine-monophosphate kinase